jgi:DNA-binding GntR family transcriptional regulator
MSAVFKSKKEIVYETLRSDIVNGKFKPGTRLVIDELASQLGVSQIPIREAVTQLEADGFVTIEPYVGATITQIDANFIFEVFALLEATEVICTRAACRVMTDDEMNQVEVMIQNMDQSVDAPDFWSEQNREMHLFICKCARTELVMKMMSKVFDHWDRLRLHYLNGIAGNRIREAQDEHRQILEALRLRDADKVEHAIREHNHRALAGYTRDLQSVGYLQGMEG